MAKKPTSKTDKGIKGCKQGELIINLFTQLDNNDIKGSIVDMKSAVRKELDEMSKNTSYLQWQQVKSMISEYGNDGAISGVIYKEFDDYVDRKCKGVRLSKLIGDRLKELYKEFMSTDEKGNRIYDVKETSSATKIKMISKINKEFDKIQEKCVSLYTELSNREGL